MSPTPPRPVPQIKNAPALRSTPSNLMSRSEIALSLPRVSRRQSKGGLRELFTKNRSTRTLTATTETDETSAESNTIPSITGNIDVGWVPPPLYQAYPQSLKHVNLEASTLSAQSIIRLNEQRSTILDHDSEQSSNGISADSASATKRPRKGSASVAKAEWTRKLYILTTSGQVLQYSGEGAFDRKPEKVLHLGKDSAAFASDAIEGRHFVLHVSQSCSDDGEAALNSSKGIFSRMGIKTATARRLAKVLLMVFETPDDLDSWLSAVRKMIGRLGGRPYSPESFGFNPKPSSQPEVNQRYITRKDPHQFSQEVHSAKLLDNPAAERPSTQSSAYTATDLERLRDSKTSNTSFLTGTPTSVLDSPPSSPAQEISALTEVPRLELPDLGPSSLVDFSKHDKRQSRLTLMFSDITRHRSAKMKPSAKSTQQASLRELRRAKTNSSMFEKEQGHEQSQEQSGKRVQEQEGEFRDSPDSQTNERPASTIAALPTSFSLQQTAPGNLRLFPDTAMSSSQIPKRYSSLEYSRSIMQSSLPEMAPAQSFSPRPSLRRPTSMQLQPEPTSSTKVPAHSLTGRSSGQGCARSAENAQKPDKNSRFATKQSMLKSSQSFGPPAGPPPSCPLPAVPADALPSPGNTQRRDKSCCQKTVVKKTQRSFDSGK